MEQCSNETMAGIVIINTCAVTGKAEKEVRQMIRRVKRENPECFLVVTGCWIDNIKNKKLNIKNTNKKLKILENIDLVAGNEDKMRIGEILGRRFSLRHIKDGPLYEDKYFKSKKALVKIQDGCVNFCTYCIVPYLRGRSRSRPADEIIEEVREKVEQGIRGVVLTGVDIASYKFEARNSKFETNLKSKYLNSKQFSNRAIKQSNNDLVKLLKLILAETKIEKISFGSVNLDSFDNELIDFFSNHKSRITNHFHISLQSGCNTTLKRMNRKYTIKEYKEVIKKLREEIPNVVFSTDVMVGFPGETEEEFEESFKNIKEIGFAKLHVFRYSPREGTLAVKMSDKWGKIPEKVKMERAKKIRGLIGKK